MEKSKNLQPTISTKKNDFLIRHSKELFPITDVEHKKLGIPFITKYI